MGRWDQYDEDDYRLPEGMVRTGYDADEGRYYYRETATGITYRGDPHTNYGVLHPVGSSGKTKNRPEPEELSDEGEEEVIPAPPLVPHGPPDASGTGSALPRSNAARTDPVPHKRHASAPATGHRSGALSHTETHHGRTTSSTDNARPERAFSLRHWQRTGTVPGPAGGGRRPRARQEAPEMSENQPPGRSFSLHPWRRSAFIPVAPEDEDGLAHEDLTAGHSSTLPRGIDGEAENGEERSESEESQAEGHPGASSRWTHALTRLSTVLHLVARRRQ